MKIRHLVIGSGHYVCITHANGQMDVLVEGVPVVSLRAFADDCEARAERLSKQASLARLAAEALESEGEGT